MQKNLAQEQVINNIYGQTIVIACPGSGKTTTLIRRIHHMVADEGINSKEIMMITFTKAAASEMNEKYIKQYGSNSGITFCTIHALCFAILRKFKNFEYENILTDSSEVLFSIVKDIREINDKANFVKDVLMDISVVKNNGISLKEFQPKCCDDKNLFIRVFKAYELSKKNQEKIDFDDILLQTYSLLKNNEYALNFIKDRYGYIHVDEYQDTNFLQRDIIYLIAGKNGNITVVGDDDQSIYGFRGARPEIMLNFKKDYPYAKEVCMSTNYRSDYKILKYAENLVKKNIKRFDKDIIAGSKNAGNVIYKQFESKRAQNIYISHCIKKLINKGINPNDIAILYRNNSQSIGIMDALMNLNIPFKSNESIESKYSHWMFRDIISYCKMAAHTGTQSDYIRTVTHPNRYLDKFKLPTSKVLDSEVMYKKLRNPYIEEWKNESLKKNINKYVSLIKCMSVYSNPEKIMNILFSLGGYEAYIKEYAEFRNQSEVELSSIWNIYKSDLQRRNINTVDEWIRYANNYNRFIETNSNTNDGVCLSTMHKSKGLEWKYVFIIDCVEGLTPSNRCDDMEEERRLFYVAMTRAKENLILCSYMSSGKTAVKESRFIKECQILDS